MALKNSTNGICYSLSLEELEFLQATDIKEYLSLAKDPLKLSTILSKKYNQTERHAILHYLEILPKIRKKFGIVGADLRVCPYDENFIFPDFLCDRLAFEQATAKDISEYKAKLWKSGAKITDLCCGMGGDSFWLENCESCGVDISKERVFMFNENMERLGKNFRAVQKDALEVEGGDFFCIDPARREGLNPSYESILELSKKFSGGMLKLPPAFECEENNFDMMYLGNNNDCRETLMLCGSLANNFIRATNLIDEWKCEKDELKNIKLEVKEIGKYILEPIPVLVRSHLFLSEARKYNLWQIDSTLAYLSSDSDFVPSGFTSYKIIAQSSLSNVKSMLKKHDIGKITLKKRGVNIVPEDEIRRLAPKGSREAILFYTRILGQKRAILAEKISTLPTWQKQK